MKRKVPCGVYRNSMPRPTGKWDAAYGGLLPLFLIDLVVGSPRMKAAVRTPILGVLPAEIRIGRKRVSDRPLAGVLVELQKCKALIFRDEELLYLGRFGSSSFRNNGRMRRGTERCSCSLLAGGESARRACVAREPRCSTIATTRSLFCSHPRRHVARRPRSPRKL